MSNNIVLDNIIPYRFVDFLCYTIGFDTIVKGIPFSIRRKEFHSQRYENARYVNI
jgi:hypothetical protein